jgi:RluA family pseudouridine synthase
VEGSGEPGNAGTVQISGILSTDLVVSLASSDSGELGVPQQVSILAGQTAAVFDLIVPDDAETDGTQLATISVNAEGFTSASNSVSVLDDDVHHFVFSEKRPGIVHRLDMGTSGVMVVAKDQPTHEGLVTLFSTHDITRKYEALIFGAPNALSGTLSSSLGRHPTNRLKMSANVKNGKKSITHFKVLNSFGPLSHIELKLETGRTHQIRVHVAELLHAPVVCDPLYGNGASHLKKLPEDLRKELENYPYQLLHAKELGFVHPITKEKLHFETKPPSIFQRVIQRLQ